MFSLSFPSCADVQCALQVRKGEGTKWLVRTSSSNHSLSLQEWSPRITLLSVVWLTRFRTKDAQRKNRKFLQSNLKTLQTETRTAKTTVNTLDKLWKKKTFQNQFQKNDYNVIISKNEKCITPLCWVTLAPPPRNRSGDTNPANQSSQSDFKGLQRKSTLDWLILHISGKIALGYNSRVKANQWLHITG